MDDVNGLPDSNIWLERSLIVWNLAKINTPQRDAKA